MLRHPAVDLIKAFTPEEIKQFRLFLRSGYFNKSRKIVLLFDVLRANLSGKGESELSKQFLWTKMKQEGSYNDSTMRSLLADLYILIKRFIISEHKHEESSSNQYILLKYCLSKNLYSHFSKLIDKIEKDQMDYEKVDFDEFHDYFQSLYLTHKYHTILKGDFNKEKVEFIGESLDKSLNILVINLLYRLLLAEGEMITIGQIFNYDIGKTNTHSSYNSIINLEMYKNIKRNYKFGYLLDLFERSNKMLSQPDNIKEFLEFKSLILKNQDKIPPKQLFHFLKVLMYFSDRHMEKSHDNNRFLKESFEFNRQILERKLYLYSDTGNIGYWRFRASYIMGVKLKKFKWVEDFINEYAGQLFPEIREPMVCLARATLEFYRRNFSEALNHLSRISTTNRMILLEMRLLYMQIYYDMEEFQQLEYAVQNYNRVNKREGISNDTLSIAVSRFVLFLHKLGSLKFKGSSPGAYKDFLKKIKTEKDLYNREWLAERCKPEKLSKN